jgi:DNA modification methylase
MTVSILTGDCREQLRTLADGSVNCIVTSPPYYGLRDYGTAKWEGGDPACDHTGADRYYTESTAAVSSSDAFSAAGEANAERLRKGRWREGGECTKCGAIHSDGQIGLEKSPEAFVAELVTVFREARRVLMDDGTLWLNIGDSYSTHAAGKVANPMAKSTLAGVRTQEVANASSRAQGVYRKDVSLPEKNLIGIPWRVAFALQNDGWYLRQDIIWHKPNPMPESVTDRCTKAHEYVFLLSKGPRYFYDAEAIAEPVIKGAAGSSFSTGKTAVHQLGRASGAEREESDTRNKRSVWSITTQPYSEAHFATMPLELAKTCIRAGSAVGGTVLDPFGGAGTTALAADQMARNAILIELNPEYAALAHNRITADAGMFGEVA